MIGLGVIRGGRVRRVFGWFGLFRFRGMVKRLLCRRLSRGINRFFRAGLHYSVLGRRFHVRCFRFRAGLGFNIAVR